MATRFARRASDVAKSDPVVNARTHVQHFILSTGERRNIPFFVLGELKFVTSSVVEVSLFAAPLLRCRFIISSAPGDSISVVLLLLFCIESSISSSVSLSLLFTEEIEDDLAGVENKSEFCSNISSGSGKQHFDMRKYIKQPTPNEMSRWRNAMENMGIRVSPNIKNVFSSSSMCSFCGIDDAAKHSGPIDTTLTVIITEPAKAKLNDIVDGLTFLLPFIRNLFLLLLLLLPAMSLSLSELLCSSSSSTG
mmetsp:Transcript_13487/g.20177  ORF Transcript_13487/g.20177 Transcript_13487/m.20177 type:complete len:250 (-) Transcript_13487:139-888(-)